MKLSFTIQYNLIHQSVIGVGRVETAKWDNLMQRPKIPVLASASCLAKRFLNLVVFLKNKCLRSTYYTAASLPSTRANLELIKHY